MSDGFSRATDDNGQTFVFGDRGEGPLVVLLHGFPDTPHGWGPIAGRVAAAGYRVVTPWLRGYHPATLVPGRGYGAELIAEDAVRLLDALEADAAVLVGHDWGASIVYGAANLDPGRVRAIVPIDIPHPSLITPSPRAAWAVRHFLALRLPWAERAVARNDFAYLDTLYRRWSPSWTGPERDASLARAKSCFADRRSLQAALDYYRALRPRVPASVATAPAVRGLVVGGTALLDGSLFERTAAALAPGSSALVFEGSGHWCHREQEERFGAALLAFLADLD